MNFNFFMDALFPQRCLRCHVLIKNGVLCECCYAGIAVHTSLFCGRCKARIPRFSSSKICHANFSYLLGAAGSYGDETMRTLIHHLKFRGIRNAAEPLAAIMARYLSEQEIDLVGYRIIPVPLSPKRRRERGFNQSELIGKLLSGHLDIPLETGILIRTRHTPPQSSTENIRERKANVRGCFTAPQNSLRGMNIVLIDDVTTSGATFLEAALAAKSAGAKKVIALAAAMT